MKKIFLFLCITVALGSGLSGEAFADADAMAAADKAKSLCSGCHGPNGISTNPIWPNLAGQKDQYLAKTMQDYKSGQRNDPNMTAMAQTLSDAEIAALASYYAALPPEG